VHLTLKGASFQKLRIGGRGTVFEYFSIAGKENPALSLGTPQQLPVGMPWLDESGVVSGGP